MEIQPGTNQNVVLRFDNDEKEVLRKLLSEMRWLLRSETRERDPVMARLFPDAYEEAEDSAAYRELVGNDLETAKIKALGTVEASIDDEDLDPEQIEAWLIVLTDIRLALGTRLEVDEDKMGAELDPDDPEAGTMTVLHWLGWIQESLLKAISDGSN